MCYYVIQSSFHLWSNLCFIAFVLTSQTSVRYCVTKFPLNLTWVTKFSSIIGFGWSFTVFYGFLGYKTPKNLNAQLLMKSGLKMVNWLCIGLSLRCLECENFQWFRNKLTQWPSAGNLGKGHASIAGGVTMGIGSMLADRQIWWSRWVFQDIPQRVLWASHLPGQ